MITKAFRLAVVAAVLVAFSTIELRSQQTSDPQRASQQKIPAGSKVYIAPMEGFETYLKAAIIKKKVPIELVEEREKADYEITGVSESKKAGAAKIIIMGSWHSKEEASIRVANIRSGEIVYAYSVHKANSAHGKKSSAEACAKHLKDEAVSSK